MRYVVAVPVGSVRPSFHGWMENKNVSLYAWKPTVGWV